MSCEVFHTSVSNAYFRDSKTCSCFKWLPTWIFVLDLSFLLRLNTCRFASTSISPDTVFKRKSWQLNVHIGLREGRGCKLIKIWGDVFFSKTIPETDSSFTPCNFSPLSSTCRRWERVTFPCTEWAVGRVSKAVCTASQGTGPHFWL